MGRPQLAHTLDRRGDDLCLVLADELDLTVSDQLQAALAEAIAQRPRILTVDLAAVTYIDSHSIGLLVQAYNTATAEGRQFTVTNPSGIVLRVMQVLGLLDTLAQQPDQAQQ